MQGSFHSHSQETPLSELWQGNDSVKHVRNYLPKRTANLCIPQTQLHSKMRALGQGFQVTSVFVYLGYQLLSLCLESGGEGFDFYTEISICLLKSRTPYWGPGTNTPNPESLWTTALGFNEPQLPALWEVMHTLAAGTVCPFAFFLNLCRRTEVCRAPALQVCGGGRGSEGEKRSHVPQQARSLQSHFTCCCTS